MEITFLDKKDYQIKDLNGGDLFCFKTCGTVYMKIYPSQGVPDHCTCVCIHSPDDNKCVGRLYEYRKEVFVTPLTQKNSLEVVRT